ncbi:MAG: VIT1/CCC1 transporter family protein [Acidimicrobiales bacterium]
MADKGQARHPSAQPRPVSRSWPPRRPTARVAPEPPLPEHHHRDVKGGAARAAVFGISDGLVSNVSLILGVAGAAAVAGPVRLAGLAGLVAGACSMAAGEYVSMRAQRELFERELDIERAEIRRHPKGEERELAHLYESRGLEPEMARALASAMMADPDMALDTHAREELGLDPGQLGSPIQAAASSFGAFAVGAAIPLVPWFLAAGGTALIASIVVSGAAALLVGAALSAFTGRSWLRSSLRQLLLSAAAAAITFGIGRLLGTTGVV